MIRHVLKYNHMLRSLTSLATSWSAYRLLRQDATLAYMDDSAAKKWAACIPIWMEQLPRLDLSRHRSWVQNLYRHGHKISQEPQFWKTMQSAVTDFYDGDMLHLESAVMGAGLFNNPMPFLHFDPYNDTALNIFGEPQIVTGMVQYIRATFKHGTHLGRQLEQLSPTPTSWDLGLFNLPIRAKDTLFPLRPATDENYWRFFYGTDEFPIGCLIDYYKDILDLNPSDTTCASWVHAAWSAKRVNPALQKDGNWEKFESQIRPLYEMRIDWELIAACNGFLLSPEHARNAEVATYAHNHLKPNDPPLARPDNSDRVTMSMLHLREPTYPWEIYTLFIDPPTPMESYSFDFK